MTTPLSHPGDDQAVAKQTLRSRLCRTRAEIARDAAVRAARAAAGHLLALRELDGADLVGLYAALDCELGTDEAAAGLLARGVALAYPRMVPQQRMLRFHIVRGLDELASGPFGIRQPPAEAEAVALDRIDVLVVPGVAFDRRGGRLGWGKGYYDTTLASSEYPLRVGYAHACQIVHEVPRASHDVHMDLVISDAGVIRTGARGGGRTGARSGRADPEEPAP